MALSWERPSLPRADMERLRQAAHPPCCRKQMNTGTSLMKSDTALEGDGWAGGGVRGSRKSRRVEGVMWAEIS